MSDKTVKFWRGTRESYNSIINKDYWTRYSVKETDGSFTEYYGENQISSQSGQILPVLDIFDDKHMPTAPNYKIGDRYVVYGTNNVTNIREYYILEILPDNKGSYGIKFRTEMIESDKGFSFRVIRKGSKAYQIINNEHITYDEVNGGTW